MKRTILILAMAIIIIQLSYISFAYSAQNTIFDYNFNSNKVDDIPTEFIISGSPTVKTVDASSDGKGMAVRMKSTSTTYAELKLNIPATVKEFYTVEFDLKSFDAGAFNFFISADGKKLLNGSPLNQQSVSLSFNGKQNISQMYNGTFADASFDATSSELLNTSESIGSFNVNEWNSYRIVSDFNKDKYSLYINDELVAEDIPFRFSKYVDYSNAKTLSFSLSSTNSDICVDNIKVYNGEKSVQGESTNSSNKDLISSIFGALLTKNSLPSVITNKVPIVALLPEAKAPEKIEIINKPQLREGVIQLPEVGVNQYEDLSKIPDSIIMFVGKNYAFVNGNKLQVDKDNINIIPIIKENTTLVPLRFISENLGAKVDYKASKKEVTVRLNNETIKMVEGSNVININGIEKKLDIPMQVIYDRTLVPLRQLVEALGKKIFYDPRGLIIISNNDKIFMDSSQKDIVNYAVSLFNTETKSNIKYSDVYLTSRWYYEDAKLNGRKNTLGTLDAIKRFMATGDKWAYDYKGNEIKSIYNLGLGLDMTLNSNQIKNYGLNITPAETIEGKSFKYDFMTWETFMDCANNPDLMNYKLNKIKDAIDNGLTQMHHDDWQMNAGYVRIGGCFCKYCMEGFTKYLKENFNEAQLKDLEIEDVDKFNFKTFLNEKYQIKTNSEWAAKKNSIKLYKIFVDFQYYSTSEHHKKISSFANSYAGKKIFYSYNPALISRSLSNPEANFLLNVFDGLMGETHVKTMDSLETMSLGAFSEATGKQIIYQAIPDEDDKIDVKKINTGIAASYSAGQFVVIPWDIWVSGSIRYYGTVEEIGALYHFIRQYPFLFDDYVMPGKIGILSNSLTKEVQDKLINTSSGLVKNGIPFKHIITNEKWPKIDFNQNNVKGLKYIIADIEISNLKPEQKEIINNSGAKIINSSEVEGLINELSAVKLTKKNSGIYTVMRDNLLKQDAAKVIHIINENKFKVDNIELEINNEYYFGDKPMEAILYAPQKDPLKLDVVNLGNGKSKIVIPNVDTWAIVRVNHKEKVETDSYVFNSGWSGINLGTREVNTNKAVQTGNNSFELKSKDPGINVATAEDTKGIQDNMLFIYKNISAPRPQNFEVSTKIESLTDGMAGVMIRQYPNSNSKFASLIYQSGKLKLIERVEDNKLAKVTEIATTTLPIFVKLERSNGEVKAYKSIDGVNWGSELGKTTIDFKKMVCGAIVANPSMKDGIANISSLNVIPTNIDETAKLISIEVKSSNKAVLEVSKTAAIMAECKTEAGDILVSEDLKLEFTSSNPEIISVDQLGKIEALQPGKSTIMVRASFGEFSIEGNIEIEAIPFRKVIIDDTFDDYRPGEIPKGWIFISENHKNNDNSYQGITLIPTDFDRSLSMYDGSTTKRAMLTYKLETPITKALIAEFEYMQKKGTSKDSKSEGTVFYMNDNTQLQSISLLASEKQFWILEKGVQKDIYPIENGKWYKIKIIADIETNKYDLFIDGKQILDQTNFRNPAKNINYLQLGDFPNAVDSYLYWNNMKVYLK